MFSLLCSVLNIVVYPLSFGHCIVCPSIYGFWLPPWYLQIFLSGFSFGTFGTLHFHTNTISNNCQKYAKILVCNLFWRKEYNLDYCLFCLYKSILFHVIDQSLDKLKRGTQWYPKVNCTEKNVFHFYFVDNGNNNRICRPFFLKMYRHYGRELSSKKVLRHA
jgi:hypothetical protein